MNPGQILKMTFTVHYLCMFSHLNQAGVYGCRKNYPPSGPRPKYVFTVMGTTMIVLFTAIDNFQFKPFPKQAKESY